MLKVWVSYYLTQNHISVGDAGVTKQGSEVITIIIIICFFSPDLLSLMPLLLYNQNDNTHYLREPNLNTSALSKSNYNLLQINNNSFLKKVWSILDYL